MTDHELARVLGVSRVTLHRWVTGANAPKGTVGKLRTAFFAETLCAAMARKVLPLPATLDRSARVGRLGAMRTSMIARFAEKIGG